MIISQDKILMKKVINGDTNAFEVLMLKYRAVSISYANKFLKDYYEAEDIVQESFAKIYIRRNDYCFDKSFKAYLFTIIKNKSIDCIRKKQGLLKINIKDVFLNYDIEDPLDVITNNESYKELLELLNILKPVHRTIFVMYEVEGFSYKEIAQITEQSLAQIKVSIYRSRKKLLKIRED